MAYLAQDTLSKINGAALKENKGDEVNHQLKIWPEYYCRVADGSKTFEVRENDRGFQPGDTVTLMEYEPKNYLGYTCSKNLEFRIGYVLPLDDRRVIFSLLPLDKK